MLASELLLSRRIFESHASNPARCSFVFSHLNHLPKKKILALPYLVYLKDSNTPCCYILRFKCQMLFGSNLVYSYHKNIFIFLILIKLRFNYFSQVYNPKRVISRLLTYMHMIIYILQYSIHRLYLKNNLYVY